MAISGVMAAAKQEAFPTVQRGAERAVARLRISFWPVVQTAVAATLAWYIATLVLGHEQPFVSRDLSVVSSGP